MDLFGKLGDLSKSISNSANTALNGIGDKTNKSVAPQQNASSGVTSRADEIEYKVYGNDLQFVEIILDPGEAVVAEAGAMMYMDRNIVMETILGDGSSSGESGGFTSKLFSAI